MPKGGWLLYALVFIVFTAMALFSIPAEQFEWQGALLMVAAGLLGVVIAYGIVPYLDSIARRFSIHPDELRTPFAGCVIIVACLLNLYWLFTDPYKLFIFMSNFSWKYIIMLGIAIVSLIVSAYSTYIHPELNGRMHFSVFASLLLIGVITLHISGFNITGDSLFWLLLANTVLVYFDARDTRNKLMMLGTPGKPFEKNFTFPNGISFSHPGKYKVETEDLDGLIYSASLSEMSLSFSVNFYKNETGQTISDIMYLREKNSKKTRQLTKTTIAGKEALLHEEYIYDDIYHQDALHRTMTVLFGDIVVMVMSIAYDKNRIEECLITAKKIENSLRFPATSASEWSFSSDINKNNIHYLTLGLQHGATQDEIRAAFQWMTEKYHPDKDSSLDAKMKFHEARLAYDALIKANPL